MKDAGSKGVKYEMAKKYLHATLSTLYPNWKESGRKGNFIKKKTFEITPETPPLI